MASKRKSPGYWKSLETCLDTSKSLMKEHELDTLPTQKKLRELGGYSGLSTAISKYHGGFTTFRKSLGEEPLIKPRKYWHSLENTLFEVKKVMEEQGVDILPSLNKLRELGYSSLVTAINNYHGGSNNFREKYLGEELLTKSPNYWKSLENTIYEAKKVMEEHNFNKFPTQKELQELGGYSGLSTAISRHHGGLLNFKEKHFGEELSTKLPNYWKSLENTISEAKKVMEKHELDGLPTQRKLTELGYSSLSFAISNYHGGFPNFREKHFGEELLKKPSGYWESLETCLDTSKSLMKEHGLDTLPSQKKFQELGYGSLSLAISKYHGGFPNFREIMNQELGIKSKEEHLTELVEDYLKD